MQRQHHAHALLVVAFIARGGGLLLGFHQKGVRVSRPSTSTPKTTRQTPDELKLDLIRDNFERNRINIPLLAD